MDITEIVRRLQQASAPDIEIDRAIAELFGFNQSLQERSSNEDGAVSRLSWVLPAGGDAATPPPYTGSLDHAYKLAQKIAPRQIDGCSWENGMGSARVNDGLYYQAASPEIALCLAALAKKIENDREGS